MHGASQRQGISPGLRLIVCRIADSPKAVNRLGNSIQFYLSDIIQCAFLRLSVPPVSTEFVQHKDGIYFRQRCRGLCGIQVKQESNGVSVALLLYRTCFIIISHTITLYRRQKKLSHQKKTDYHLHILRGRIYFLNCIPGYHDFCAYPAIKNRHLTGRCRTIILIPWTSVSRRTKIGQFYRTISSSGLTQCVGGIIIEEKLCRISAIPALSTRCAAWKRRQKYKEERVCLKTYIKTSASAACACR